jgi:hypothetical protein
VLCDAVTYGEAKAAFRFDDVPPLMLKGKGVVAGVRRPREAAQSVGDGAARGAASATTRQRELTLIEARLDALVEQRRGGLIVVRVSQASASLRS